MQNFYAFLSSAFVCFSYLEGCKALATVGVWRRGTCRKLIHIGCGLLYLLLWPLYEDNPAAPYWCGAVPIIATFRYLAVGLGLIEDKALLLSTSRTGNKEELLKGPIAYGIVHGLAAILFWRRMVHVPGITVITVLCAGDGLAELVGTRLGAGNPLPHNPSKESGRFGKIWEDSTSITYSTEVLKVLTVSWAGSLACLGGALVATHAFLQYFCWLNLLVLSETPGILSLKVLVVCLSGTIIESLAIENWDNITISLGVAFVSKAIFSD